MSANYVFTTKTQHYLKVKKPLLERQRRARINKCLDALKLLVAEFQSDDAIMRMDKAEMLETTIAFMRTTTQLNAGATNKINTSTPPPPAQVPMDSFRNGYMNAVNEVSRVMASTPDMSVQVGKSVMTHLGCEFNRLLQYGTGSSAPLAAAVQPIYINTRTITSSSAPLSSPASSGYHSDCDENSLASPVAVASVWRPW